ncbi:MAG: ATP synthase F1 subunit gamma [Coriobacteriaceae bacterium]|nr:MAG: ATP synthase F1 subunit gamma [Coriobacteriaceae bacterium]
MPNLKEISRRIASIKSTMQITRTMEMISTAKIRKALERAQEAAPYKDAIKNMLANVANAGIDVNQPLLQEHEKEKTVLFILIASDRGLAGGFNINLEREVMRAMQKLQREGKQTLLITCGRKPTDYFNYRGVKPVMSFTGISSEPTDDEADHIASYAMDGYTSGSIDRIMIYYMHARNRMQQDEVREQLLPVGAEDLAIPNPPRSREAVSKVGQTMYTEFTFDPSATRVLGYLMPAYIRTVIFHALLDSAAAEHGARRRAMQSATDNANDMVTSLSRMYNRVRQSSITTELNDIVGGASALEDNN